MLSKLLKYDFKSMLKMHFLLYSALIILAILTKIINLVSIDFQILNFIKGFSNILFVLLVIGSFLGTFIISIARFYNNLIKDEGYLTHTLPVKTSQIILSKLITSVIFSIITTILCVGVLILVYYQKGFFPTLFDSFNNLSKLLNTSSILMILVFLVSAVIGIVSQILMVYLGIGIGQMYTSKKLVYSVVYTILIYTIVQFVSTIALLIATAIFPNLMETLNSEIISASYYYGIMALANVLSIGLSILFYIVTIKIFTKKINMD